MSKVISLGALFLADCDDPIAEALSTRILEVCTLHPLEIAGAVDCL